MMCASPNAKVHGVIMMLSPMKPSKKFDTITSTLFSTMWATIFYNRCPQQLFRLPMHYNMWMQYYPLLHSFIKCDRSCGHIYVYIYAMIMTRWVYNGIYHSWVSIYTTSGIYADSGVVHIFELQKHCMPESSCVRLRGVYDCPLSCLASFKNNQSQWHSSVVSLMKSTLMGHFWSLHSLRFSAMMWTWTFFGFDADSRWRFVSGRKSLSESWEWHEIMSLIYYPCTRRVTINLRYQPSKVCAH